MLNFTEEHGLENLNVMGDRINFKLFLSTNVYKIGVLLVPRHRTKYLGSHDVGGFVA